jgi:hypothetical protein
MSSLLDSLNSLHSSAVFLADGAVPQPQSDAPDQLTGKVNTVLGIAAWAGTAAGVAGVLITGAMMAISVKRGESSEHMSRLGMVLGGCVLVATAGPLIQFVFE